MHTTTITAILILVTATCCLGRAIPLSSVTKDENRETTTFRRDGKTILKATLYRSNGPERRMLRQAVVFNDKEVAFMTDFQGKRLFQCWAQFPCHGGYSKFIKRCAGERNSHG